MGEPTIGNFIDRNWRLFTVLGVFGAISVYLTQLQVTSRWRRLGIVASLAILLLVAVTIQRNIPPETSEKRPFDFIINIRRQRIGLTVFYVTFWAVVISVPAIVLRHSDTFLSLLQFLLFVVGIGGVRFFVGRVEIPDEHSDGESSKLGEDYGAVIILAAISRVALFGIALGGGSLVLLWWGLIPIRTLLAFHGTSFPSVFVLGTMSGVVVDGFLWVSLVLMALFVHYTLRWMQSIGEVDDDCNLNEEFFSLIQEDD